MINDAVFRPELLFVFTQSSESIFKFIKFGYLRNKHMNRWSKRFKLKVFFKDLKNINQSYATIKISSKILMPIKVIGPNT